MPKAIIIETNGEIINSTDWKAKSEDVIKKLQEDVFSKINPEDSYVYRYDSYGNVTFKTKRALKKGEIMPSVSPAQITTKLNRYLRIYRPMTSKEAMTLADTDYLEAYGYYLDIISAINEYVTFVADKQTFSAFCNITVDIYNELLSDPKYNQVFSSIEDGFVQSNFSVAEAGLIDNKTVITKLQTKNAGHSLIKSPESITIVNNTKVDRVQIQQKLEKAMGLLNAGKGEKK